MNRPSLIFSAALASACCCLPSFAPSAYAAVPSVAAPNSLSSSNLFSIERLLPLHDQGQRVSNQVSKSQFKAKALEFFRQVETGGKPVVITDHGEPKLEVRRY